MAQTELQRAANPVPRLLEKQIQQTCCEFLEWDGWRRIRMEAISEASFIERAMAKMLKHPTLSLRQFFNGPKAQVNRASALWSDTLLPSSRRFRLRAWEKSGWPTIYLSGTNTQIAAAPNVTDAA